MRHTFKECSGHAKRHNVARRNWRSYATKRAEDGGGQSRADFEKRLACRFFNETVRGRKIDLAVYEDVLQVQKEHTRGHRTRTQNPEKNAHENLTDSRLRSKVLEGLRGSEAIMELEFFMRPATAKNQDTGEKDLTGMR